MNSQEVLVIEDESIAQLWKDHLEQEISEIRVDIARKPEEGLKKIKDVDYKILIIDIMMYPAKHWDQDKVAHGFLSGIQFHKDVISICEKQGRRPPELIIVSALAAVKPSLYNGAKAYFSKFSDAWFDKPFSLAEFVEKVKQLLRRTEEEAADSNTQ